MTYYVEATVRFAVEAESNDKAIEIAKEGLTSLNDAFAAVHIYEWTNPTIYEDHLSGNNPTIVIVDEIESAPDTLDNLEYQGYHRFRNSAGEEYGSFNVTYLSEAIETADEPYGVGWYWVSEFPGCLPDGDMMGPFPTAEGAYLDAMEGSGS